MPDKPPQIREPWERQTGETAQAYHAFTIYRDLGPRYASIANTLQALRDEDTTATSHGHLQLVQRTPKRRQGQKAATKRLRDGTVERWCSEHRWVERAGAWWEEQDRQQREEQLRRFREMGRVHAEILDSAIGTLGSIFPSMSRQLAKAREANQDPWEFLGLEDQAKLALLVGRIMPSLMLGVREARSFESPEPMRVMGGIPERTGAGLLDDMEEAAEAWRASQQAAGSAGGSDD